MCLCARSAITVNIYVLFLCKQIILAARAYRMVSWDRDTNIIFRRKFTGIYIFFTHQVVPGRLEPSWDGIWQTSYSFWLYYWHGKIYIIIFFLQSTQAQQDISCCALYFYRHVTHSYKVVDNYHRKQLRTITYQ